MVSPLLSNSSAYAPAQASTDATDKAEINLFFIILLIFIVNEYVQYIDAGMKMHASLNEIFNLVISNVDDYR